jgi:disulfide bond formation protein DsbB
MTASGSASIVAMLDRLILLAMLVVIAAILTAAMAMQYALGEIPCPLCLLQRVAMFGCCFGLIQQLRLRESERGSGIALIFALLLLVISVRQTLLDIYPRPGHDYIGSAVLGLHLPVWSVIIAAALLLGLAVRLALFSGGRAAKEGEDALPRALVQPLVIYVAVICAINFLSVLAQCGLDQCHTFGYRLFQ